MKLAWDRIMETCQNHGDGVLLKPGIAGCIVEKSGLRDFDVVPIDAQELAEMIEDLLPGEIKHIPSTDRYIRHKTGYIEFDVAYGQRWFRVAVFDYPTPSLVFLKLLPSENQSGN